jgi:hypothetical protein
VTVAVALGVTEGVLVTVGVAVTLGVGHIKLNPVTIGLMQKISP